jgi:hypothetical protein
LPAFEVGFHSNRCKNVVMAYIISHKNKLTQTALNYLVF